MDSANVDDILLLQVANQFKLAIRVILAYKGKYFISLVLSVIQLKRFLKLLVAANKLKNKTEQKIFIENQKKLNELDFFSTDPRFHLPKARLDIEKNFQELKSYQNKRPNS